MAKLKTQEMIMSGRASLKRETAKFAHSASAMFGRGVENQNPPRVIELVRSHKTNAAVTLRSRIDVETKYFISVSFYIIWHNQVSRSRRTHNYTAFFVIISDVTDKSPLLLACPSSWKSVNASFGTDLSYHTEKSYLD